MLLELRGLSVSYDTAEVLHGISLEVAAGETVTLIGGSVSQVQSGIAGSARYYRLVQVQ